MEYRRLDYEFIIRAIVSFVGNMTFTIWANCFWRLLKKSVISNFNRLIYAVKFWFIKISGYPWFIFSIGVMRPNRHVALVLL